MTRICYVLRGIPGSGKSTFTHSLIQPNTLVDIVSADHYFMKSGRYSFDPKRIKYAHEECWDNFQEALKRGISPNIQNHTIAVDNTNTTVWECEKYVLEARRYGYSVEIINILCSPEIAAARCLHGVPLAKIHEMNKRMTEAKLPADWKVTNINQEDS